MKCYFHSDSNIYRTRAATFIGYTAVPAAFIAVLLTLCLMLSARYFVNNALFYPAAGVICGLIFVCALAARIVLQVSDNLVRVHSRYTYIEIGQRDIIVSLYAGKIPESRYSPAIVLRRLWVIPLSGFESAEVTGGGRVFVRAEGIRAYRGNSARLGYRFRDGALKFDEFYYGETSAGYETAGELLLPRKFGGAAQSREIVAAFYAAKEIFDSLPAPKPYVFRELPEVKARRIRETARRMRGEF